MICVLVLPAEDPKLMTVTCYIIDSFCQYVETFCVTVRKWCKSKLELAEELTWLSDVIAGASNSSRYDKRSNKNVG